MSHWQQISMWDPETEERLRIAERVAQRELDRIRRLLYGEEALRTYRDLVVDGEIDEGRPFPEELD